MLNYVNKDVFNGAQLVAEKLNLVIATSHGNTNIYPWHHGRENARALSAEASHG